MGITELMKIQTTKILYYKAENAQHLAHKAAKVVNRAANVDVVERDLTRKVRVVCTVKNVLLQ